jgi:HPt (histidine-containing phosphotransfer) domain-containing protein
MIYTLDKLNELSGGDQDFINSIISVFVDETPQDLSDLKLAIEVQAFDAIYQHAHKIKPNVDLLGMDETTAHILSIETEAKSDKNIGRIEKLFPKVEASIKDCIAQLKENHSL